MKQGAEFFDCCKKAEKLLILAPSSYLGGLYTHLVVAELGNRFPSLKLTAIDDVWFADPLKAPRNVDVLPISALASGELRGTPSINCSYSLATWLTFRQASVQAGNVHFDLPEVLYALDLPLVYQSGSVTRRETLEHLAEFETVRDRLADDLSRATLDAILRFRMDGNRGALLDILSSGEQEYFSFYRGGDHPIRLGEEECYIDIGAYDGDTVRKFLTAVRHEYNSIHAFEPDPTNFDAMRRSLGEDTPRLVLHNQAVSDCRGTLSFAAKGNMGSRAEVGGGVQVPCIRLDDELEWATLIKMDVEGHEPEVLRGGSGLIARCKPRLAITCYHHALDLLAIISVLDQIQPGARLYLRHYSMFFYDTILYVDWLPPVET